MCECIGLSPCKQPASKSVNSHSLRNAQFLDQSPSSAPSPVLSTSHPSSVSRGEVGQADQIRPAWRCASVMGGNVSVSCGIDEVLMQEVLSGPAEPTVVCLGECKQEQRREEERDRKRPVHTICLNQRKTFKGFL
ncbi:hypothetical protein WMY93_021500 [Mugilogobius chulae]|uniref:Uncharacterized protein n=1 Tax=Mugilogobius chulae TaxID=88201 RepID=A0AAW0NCC1_9GOBI